MENLIPHFTHAVTYLRSLGTPLSREGFDENLTWRIEDETRRLMAHLSASVGHTILRCLNGLP